MNPLLIISGIKTGIEVYKTLRPIIKSIRHARHPSPYSSKMVLSPDGNPMYHTSFKVDGNRFKTMEY